MLKKLSFVLFLILINLGLIPSGVQARDPYPNKARLKYQLMPVSLGANPKTMLSPDGQRRSGLISFSCDGFTNNPQSQAPTDKVIDKVVFLTALDTDTLDKATAACSQRYHGLYTSVDVPFIKDNKQTAECAGKDYDPNCYDSPLGDDFLESANDPPGFKWVTPLVYSAQEGRPSLCGPNHDQLCGPSCIYTPFGPKETFVKLTNGAGEECVAPPYSTSGPWWDWLVSQITGIRGGIPQSEYDKLVTVGMYFGIDGEGRPLKSDAGWSANINIQGQFMNYAAAVMNLVKSKYPGKVVRGQTDGSLVNIFLENGVDFHRESLNADGVNNYLYKGLGTWGWWQGFANDFWVTNSQGLAQGWPPMYQSVLAALSMHTDMITGIITNGLYDNGKPDFLKFTNDYIGRDINDTPGVWSFLRETTYKKESGGANTSGKYGDYDFYLYRPEDLDNNHTVPVKGSEVINPNPLTKSQIYSWNEQPVFGVTLGAKDFIVGRKNAANSNYMSFDIDDGYRYADKTGVSYNVRVIYLDVGTTPLKFQYKNSSDQPKEYVINKTNSLKWQEAKFTLTDAFFNNNMSDYPYPTDFRLETNGTTIHLVEVRGTGQITQTSRPKAQVSCDIVENQTDDPKEGILSLGLNRNFFVKARLVDNNNNSIDNERIMFAYNTEWNLAKSAKTQNGGYAFSPLTTTTRLDSSGFLGVGYRDYQDSTYSVQVFYPGSDKYQPSRNDCYIHLVSSSRSDANNTRMKITNIDSSQVSSTGKLKVSYDIYDTTGTKIISETRDIGKTDGFYASDPNAQTISILWNVSGHSMTANHITVQGSGTFPTEPPYPTNAPTQPPQATQSPQPTFPAGGLAGDTNGDGHVGLADIGYVYGHYDPNCMATPAPGSLSSSTTGDFNHNGCVDLGDVGIVSSRYDPNY